MTGVFWIEGGCLQSFEVFPTDALAVKRAGEWAAERGMTAENSGTFDPETGSYHDDETDIYVMQPENTPFSSQERNTILAALRLWQDFQRHQSPDWSGLNAIATNEGKSVPLLANEIDALCERFND